MTLQDDLANAPEGSEELDVAIWRSLDPDNIPYEDDDGVWMPLFENEDGGPWEQMTPYTTSIDAALTLVPDGWWLQMLEHAHTLIRFAGDKHEPLGWNCFLQSARGGTQQRGKADTPAIAIVLAALAARDLAE